MQIGVMGRAIANKIVKSLHAQYTRKLQDRMKERLKNSISFYDASGEVFYHGLVLWFVDKYDI